MDLKDLLSLADILNGYIEEPYELFNLSQSKLKTEGIKFSFIKKEAGLFLKENPLFFNQSLWSKKYDRESQISSVISQHFKITSNTEFNQMVSNPCRYLSSWNDLILIEGEEVGLVFKSKGKLLKSYSGKISKKGLEGQLSYNRKLSFLKDLPDNSEVDLTIKSSINPLKNMAIKNLSEDGFLVSFRKENEFVKKQSLEKLKNLVRPNTFLSLYLFFSNPGEYVRPSNKTNLEGVNLNKDSLEKDDFCNSMISKIKWLQSLDKKD